MGFINLATSSLGMINPIETFSSVYNLYFFTIFDEIRIGGVFYSLSTNDLYMFTTGRLRNTFPLSHYSAHLGNYIVILVCT